jgi:hypothetical protein
VLAPAVTATIDYPEGNTTCGGVADDLGVPAVEAIAVTQAIEWIIAVVNDHDPTLDEVTFDVNRLGVTPRGTRLVFSADVHVRAGTVPAWR